jgi:hypothetical protein
VWDVETGKEVGVPNLQHATQRIHGQLLKTYLAPCQDHLSVGKRSERATRYTYKARR